VRRRDSRGWVDDPRIVAFFEKGERRPDTVAFHAMTTALATPPPGGQVLDVGCGIGVATLGLGHLVGPMGTVIGVDDKPAFIEAARRRAEWPVRFECAPLHPLQYPDDEFDYVRSTWAHKGIPDPRASVQELVRVCQPGGQIVLVDVDARSLAIDAASPELVEAVIGSVYGALRRQRSGLELRGHLVRAGLTEAVASPYVFTATSLEDAAGLVPELDPSLPSRIPAQFEAVYEDWVTALKRADAEGALLVTLTAWAAAARKPHR